MNIDKSDYYPKSNLDDEDDEREEGLEIEATAVIVTADGEEADKEKEEAAPTHPSGFGILEGPDPEDQTEAERCVTGFAHFFSWALVPMFMPVYGIMLCFGLTVLNFTSFGTRVAFTFITAAFNVVAPMIVVVLLKRFGMIKDIGLNNREERFIPYLVCIVCLVGTALFMLFRGSPIWLVMFFFGGAAAGLVEVIINRWWKISVHAAGIAGIVALLLYLLQFEFTIPATKTWLLISIGASGLLGSSRIWLGRHTLWQVLAGYAVGFCAVYFLMFV